MTVAELRDLVGHEVLLLGWPTGSKGTKQKWGHLTIASMTPPWHISPGWRPANIGVALGKVSGDLVVLDVDDDALVETVSSRPIRPSRTRCKRMGRAGAPSGFA